MKNKSFPESIFKHWAVAFAATAVLAPLYYYTDSGWVLVLLVPCALVAFAGLVYGDMLGRVVFGGASKAYHLINKQALGKWQGNYYEWERHQIRVVDSDKDVWIVDEDLIGAAGFKLDAKLRRQLDISYPGYRNIPDT